MNKFAKIISLVLAIAMISCFAAACSNNDKQPAKKTHDPITLQVTGSDKIEGHKFVDGKCTMCDTTSIFTSKSIAGTDYVLTPCDEQGTIIPISYDTRSYCLEAKYPDAGELPVTKNAYVYLPYGYDANDKTTKYDVLFLLHGSGQDEGNWFAQGHNATDHVYMGGYGTNNVFDKLIKEGKSKKVIVVTPTLYSPVEGYEIGNNDDRVTKNFGKELIGDLMPYIAENFNTYAASGSAEDLKASRDHFAYAGGSLGSMTSYDSVWSYCLEYISYIASISGSNFVNDDWKSMIDTINTTYADCKINYWYVGLGTVETDQQYPGNPFGGYLALSSGVKGLTRGENCEFVLVQNTSHNYATSITSLYNAMQVFFQK